VEVELNEIKIGLKSGDEEIRRSAIQSLKNIPLAKSRSIIFCALGDTSWRVRKEAVEALLCLTPDESDIDQLLDLLRSEDNAGLRNSAAEAVIRLGSAASMSLIRMAKDPDAEVRKFVIDLMGAIGDKVFVKHMLNALNDPDVNVSSAAAEHLGTVGDSSVIPDLIRAIVANQTVLFRFSALGALGALTLHPTAVPIEILRLADEDILRKSVYDCLGNISDDSSLSLLLSGFGCQQKSSRSSALKAVFKIYSRSDSSVRQKIDAELRGLNGNDSISGLLSLFDCRDSALTEALIWCSMIIGDIRFVPVLIESCADERFAESALKSLKSLGPEGTAIAVMRYDEANEAGQSAICTLIGECGYSGYGDLIKNALDSHSARIRRAAINSAAKLGMASLIPELVALTDDIDQSVSTAAVSSLQLFSLIDRPNILAVARQFSSSESPRQRRYASLLYSSLGEHERLDLLARDEDFSVRQAAINAIGSLRLKSSGTILVMALVDESPDVRIAAADALGLINEKCVLDALEHALDDEDTWVRCAALKAIARIDRDSSLAIIKRLHSGSGGLFMITCLQLLEADCRSDALQIIKDALNNNDPDIARQAVLSLDRCTSSHKFPGHS
jgi:HEAT repeat protein